MNNCDFYRNNNNIQIAHRGYSGMHPENTFAAFEAILGKTNMMEIDVAFTKDEVAVIIHDDTLKRTSNVENIYPLKKEYLIHQFTLHELQKLDFSSWFIKDDSNNITSQRIPTLEDVLVFCKYNKIILNIEIKDLSNTPYHQNAVDNIVALIKKYKMELNTIISSFNSFYILQLNKKYPNFNKALIAETPLENLEEFLLNNNIQAYHCSHEIITKQIVQDLLQHNIFTCVFTVNDDKRKKELHSWGVKGVFTDYLE